MARNSWVQQQIDEFQRLRGRRVSGWVGVEMALREEDADGKPQFEDPEVPCLQLSRLRVLLVDGSVDFAEGSVDLADGSVDLADGSVDILTYLDDVQCALCAERSRLSLPIESEGIFRTRRLEELPVGVLSDVGVELDERGNVSRVQLDLASGRELWLVAGEVYEEFGGELSLCSQDESVLVFPSKAALDSVRWKGH